jgi:hypothetical protein
MKHLSLIALVALHAVAQGSVPGGLGMASKPRTEIAYSNRPLITINGKTLSLVDVIKKMDFQLLQYAPQVLDNPESRFEYYNQNWRRVYAELVEMELVMIDAEPLKIGISEADIRMELESLGPQLIIKLDSIGLTLNEAKAMVENDMIMRQMLWYKAYSKALQVITPESIKIAYNDYFKEETLKQKEHWCYQVLTIKSKDSAKGEKAAWAAHTLLSKEGSIMAAIPDALKKTLQSSSDDVELTLSKDLRVDSHSISKQHHEILCQLQPHEYSQPVVQLAKNQGEEVRKIFYLKEHSIDAVKTFQDMASSLKDKLTQIAAEKERKNYIESLKKKLLLSDAEIFESISKEEEPFALL